MYSLILSYLIKVDSQTHTRKSPHAFKYLSIEITHSQWYLGVIKAWRPWGCSASLQILGWQCLRSVCLLNKGSLGLSPMIIWFVSVWAGSPPSPPSNVPVAPHLLNPRLLCWWKTRLPAYRGLNKGLMNSQWLEWQPGCRIQLQPLSQDKW